MQVSVQVLLLLLSRTSTPTTGGLETIFDERNWKIFDATTAFVLSILWSLLSTIKTNTNLIILEKGFCPTTSKIVVLAWSMFATLKRILSLVTLFIPSMGLFSLLHHWKWEQVPFNIRKEHTKSILSEDKISLFGLKKTVFWSELDRWKYADSKTPTPPNYTTYTFMTLQETFFALIVLSIAQFIALYLVKICISKDFREENLLTNRFLHVIENINFSSPFRDWDDGDYSIQQFKKRANSVRKEMIWTQTINFLTTILMVVPLCYTGKNVQTLDI